MGSVRGSFFSPGAQSPNNKVEYMKMENKNERVCETGMRALVSNSTVHTTVVTVRDARCVMRCAVFFGCRQ